MKYAVIICMVCSMALHGGVYEQKCVPCHRNLPVSLGQMFKKYLLIYSSEKFVKAGIKYYLKEPSRSISVMSNLFLDLYGIKQKSSLSDKEIDEAIDTYWETYKVSDTLQ